MSSKPGAIHYKQADGWRYRRLVGDLRKVKRLVNLLLLLRIGEVRFDVQDFDNTDLLHLLLLYLTYPRTFRAIYASESDEQQGIFAITREYRAGSYLYQNHPEFAKYIENCDPDEKLLLERLFSVTVVAPNNSFGNSNEEQILRTRACYNSQIHRNLARYLRLIVDLTAAEPTTSLAYYISHFTKFKEGTPLAEVIQSLDQSSEKPTDEFWRVLSSRADELSSEQVAQAINVLVSSLPQYSFLESPELGIGIRDTCILTLLRVLDGAAWSDERSQRRNNSDMNVMEIADWIFGSVDTNQLGLVRRLGDDARGVLGIFDLLLFRLYCNPSRSSLFNISKALIRRADPNAPTAGVLNELNKITVRELSQAIFSIFARRYIQGRRNFFEEAGELTVNELAGRFASDVLKSLEEVSDARIGDHVHVARRRALDFCVYQLTNKFTGDAVGCGFYDQAGNEDRGGIAEAMNAYIFDYCFNPDVQIQNAYYFADHMLSNLERDLSESGFRSHEAGLVRGFDKARLVAYWTQHRETLLPLAREERKVVTANYVATYTEYLPGVFDMLDQIAQSD